MKKILFVLILIATVACKKPIVELDPAYIGYWVGGNGNGTHYSIHIDSNSDGSYHRDFWGGSESEEYWKGDVAASKTHIKFGHSPCFKILEAPTPADSGHYNSSGNPATWKLKLKYPLTIGYDGAEFTVYR